MLAYSFGSGWPYCNLPRFFLWNGCSCSTWWSTSTTDLDFGILFIFCIFFDTSIQCWPLTIQNLPAFTSLNDRGFLKSEVNLPLSLNEIVHEVTAGPCHIIIVLVTLSLSLARQLTRTRNKSIFCVSSIRNRQSS